MLPYHLNFISYSSNGGIILNAPLFLLQYLFKNLTISIMRVLTYSGTSGDCIEVEKPTDLYTLIDWFIYKMKLSKCSKNDIHKIEIIKDCVETIGLGNEIELEKIKYI